ncbi:MAG: winged helix-turn-helix domain-containing tetratricopeptide repeat protein, partial [Thermoanaerobaculia bacterium]
MNGARVRLQEQPARLLAVLLENAGRTVGRDELRQRLWSDNTFVDFEHGLNTAIRKLRVALDDTADTPRWIETIPRMGYRFIGPVEGIGDATTPAPAAAPRSRVARSWILGAAVVALIVLAATALLRERGPTRGEPIDAIAVLPFTNPDAQTRHLSDGMTEALINGLAEMRDLRVMARTTVFEFAGTPVDAKRAGRKLNVPAVVTGSMQMQGEQVALQVEMIDVRDGAQLWGRRYEGTRRSLQALQRQIVDDLSRQIRPESARVASSRIPASTGADAYELYLKGLHAWNKRHPDDLELAVQYFHEALKIEPQFALAWAGLANAWGVMAGSGLYPASVMQPRASAAAEKALAIDPNLAEAIASRAAGMYQQGFDFKGAEREYLRAIALNPSYPTAHAWYSQLLTDLGRPDEARVQVELAYQLDPLSPAINWNRCWNYVSERRYEKRS